MPSTITDRLYGESSGVAVKAPCVAVSVGANLPLSGLASIGAYTPNEGDRILVKDQADQTTNGIYNASQSIWQRTGDFDGAYDVTEGTLVVVLQGATGIFYQLTTDNPVIGTSQLIFQQVWQPPSVTYPQLPIETTLGIVATNTSYQPGDPRRYPGADSTGTFDSTTAVQDALDVAYAMGADVYIGPNCTYLCGALSITMTGNHSDQGLRIRGASRGGSVLKLNGNPTALLTISGATPTGNPTESQFVLEDATLTCAGNTTTDGLLLQGIAYWQLVRSYILNFNRNLNLSSALTGTVDSCGMWGGNYGIYGRADGAGSSVNLVRVRDTIIDGAAIWGIDLGQGSRFKAVSCDLESNGTQTAITFTAGPAQGATNATLTANWALPTAAYPVYFSDGEVRFVTLTLGATTATWTTGLTAGVTTAATASTGAVVLRSTMTSGSGFATADLDGCWFENNNGQTFAVESASGLSVAVNNCSFLADANGRAVFVNGIGHFSARDCIAPSGGGDIWNLNATDTVLENMLMTSLIDSSTNKHYQGAVTGTGTVYSPVPAASAPFTANGIAASVPSNTATTLTTLSAENFGVYLFSAAVPAVNDPSDYSSTAIVSVNGASNAALIQIQAGAKVTLSMSGMSVQVTQTNAAAQQVNWSMLRIGA